MSRCALFKLTPPPSDLRIIDGEGRLVVRIGADGTIEVGKDMTPDEAARAFWEAVAKLAPEYVRAQS